MSASKFQPVIVNDGSGKAPTASTHIRIARPSKDLTAAERFYVQGLGLKVLYRKTYTGERGHEDSILMLGFPGAAWHLELVYEAAPHSTAPVPTSEDLLVLYLDGKIDGPLVDRAVEMGGQRVKSRNAYWDDCGLTVADPDGYRVVLAVRAWENEEMVE
jgi:hypothetical protein